MVDNMIFKVADRILVKVDRPLAIAARALDLDRPHNLKCVVVCQHVVGQFFKVLLDVSAHVELHEIPENCIARRDYTLKEGKFAICTSPCRGWFATRR